MTVLVVKIRIGLGVEEVAAAECLEGDLHPTITKVGVEEGEGIIEGEEVILTKRPCMKTNMGVTITTEETGEEEEVVELVVEGMVQEEVVVGVEEQEIIMVTLLMIEYPGRTMMNPEEEEEAVVVVEDKVTLLHVPDEILRDRGHRLARILRNPPLVSYHFRLPCPLYFSVYIGPQSITQLLRFQLFFLFLETGNNYLSWKTSTFGII